MSEGDLLQAYIINSVNEEEIIGLTNADFANNGVSGVVNYNNNKYIEVSVYTENLPPDTTIFFKLYKKDTVSSIIGNKIYDLNSTLLLQSLNNYTSFNITNILDLGTVTLNLSGQFTDFSFNVDVPNPTKENIFYNKYDTNSKVINQVKSYRSQFYTAVQISNDIWISSTMEDGTLFSDSQFNVDTFYTVELYNPITIHIIGNPLSESRLITLNKGYNWIGYTASRKNTLDSIFSNLSPKTFISNGNTYNTINSIISRNDGSAINTNMGFLGSLTHMEPGKGYIVYIGNSNTMETFTSTLTYYNSTSFEIYSTPQGYYKLQLINNPFPTILGNIYVFINDSKINVSFIYENELYFIESPVLYSGFGVYDTDFVTLNKQDIVYDRITLTHMKLRLGFTTENGYEYSINGILDFKVQDNISSSTFILSEHALALLNVYPPYTFAGIQTVSIPNDIVSNIGVSPITQSIPNIENIYKLLYVNSTTNLITFEMDLTNMTTTKPAFFNSMILEFIPGSKLSFDSIITVSPISLSLDETSAFDNKITIRSNEGIPLSKLTITIKYSSLSIPVDLIYPGIESKLYYNNNEYSIFEFETTSFTPTPTSTPSSTVTPTNTPLGFYDSYVTIKNINTTNKMFDLILDLEIGIQVSTIEVEFNSDTSLNGIYNIVTMNEGFDLKFAQGNKLQLISLIPVTITDSIKFVLQYSHISDHISIQHLIVSDQSDNFIIN